MIEEIDEEPDEADWKELHEERWISSDYQE